MQAVEKAFTIIFVVLSVLLFSFIGGIVAFFVGAPVLFWALTTGIGVTILWNIPYYLL